MPASCKKTHDFIALRVFSNIDDASLPQNVYYRVIAAAGTWRGETDAWGLHGGDLAVGLARMLLQSVPMD